MTVLDALLREDWAKFDAERAARLGKLYPHLSDPVTGARLENVRAATSTHPTRGTSTSISADIHVGKAKVGSLSRFYYPDTNTIVRERTSIDDAHQKRGIATGLHAAEETMARAAGVSAIESVPISEGGKRLTARQGGFSPVEGMPGRVRKALREGVLDLLLESESWRTQPRDDYGRWRSELGDAVRELRPGHKIAVPGVGHIHLIRHQTSRMTSGKFDHYDSFAVATPDGHITTSHRTPEGAVDDAMNRSARSAHPLSLGGATTYEDEHDARLAGAVMGRDGEGLRDKFEREAAAQLDAMENKSSAEIHGIPVTRLNKGRFEIHRRKLTPKQATSTLGFLADDHHRAERRRMAAEARANPPADPPRREPTPEPDRHGGFKVGDKISYRTGSRFQGRGPVTYVNQPGVHTVAGLQRNGNLRVRDSEFGTTHDVHHSDATLKQRARESAPAGIGLLLEDYSPAEKRDRAGKWTVTVGSVVHAASDVSGYIGKGKVTQIEPDTGHLHVKLDDGRNGRVRRDQVFRTRKAAVELTKMEEPAGIGAVMKLGMVGRPNSKAARLERERQAKLSRQRLSEAFGPPPGQTPQQTLAAAPAQIAAAKTATAAAWNAQKHPRTVGGKWATVGGSTKTATTSRYLKAGTHGTMVAAIQRQLGIPPDGVYGPQTKAAVAKYQRQHGLQVDGVIGRQTLAGLRGHTNPSAVKPGAIKAPATASSSRSTTLSALDHAQALAAAERRVIAHDRAVIKRQRATSSRKPAPARRTGGGQVIA